MTVINDDHGMTTVEYALGTLAAAAFATVLYLLARSDWVQTALQELIQRAFTVSM